MKLITAEQILSDFCAQKTMLGDFAPPKGKDLIPYEITPAIEIHFLVDPARQDKIIENIYICNNRNKAKSEQKWNTVAKIDLKNMEPENYGPAGMEPSKAWSLANEWMAKSKYALKYERKATSVGQEDNYFIVEFKACDNQQKPLKLKVDLKTGTGELINETHDK
jgi:hypothetical protein